MAPNRRGNVDDGHEVAAEAHAATRAADDAQAMARSAAGTTTAARDLVLSASEVASAARDATAATVAAAAEAAAEVAARAATKVQADAVTQSLKTAALAVVALETIAAELSDDVDPDGAKRTAAAVAARVAADVIAQANATSAAAATVAHAVTLAADEAAIAAATAAAIVDLAAGSAEASAHALSGSSAKTETASDAVVESTEHVADLAHRRLARLPQDPLVGQLRAALVNDELRLHYQPLYSLATRARGRCRGAAALAASQAWPAVAGGVPRRGGRAAARRPDRRLGHRDGSRTSSALAPVSRGTGAGDVGEHLLRPVRTSTTPHRGSSSPSWRRRASRPASSASK